MDKNRLQQLAGIPLTEGMNAEEQVIQAADMIMAAINEFPVDDMEDWKEDAYMFGSEVYEEVKERIHKKSREQQDGWERGGDVQYAYGAPHPSQYKG